MKTSVNTPHPREDPVYLASAMLSFMFFAEEGADLGDLDAHAQLGRSLILDSILQQLDTALPKGASR